MPDQLDDLRRPPSRRRLWLAFLVLFAAFQLPEGLGQRVLHSLPVHAALSLAFLPLAWLVGRWLGFRGLDAWYLGRRAGWLALLAAAFALAVLAKAAALALGAGAGVYRIEALPGVTLEQAAGAALLMLPYTFLPSIAEDVLTRGFLMRAAPVLARRWAFVVVSALLFVLNHIYRLANGPAEWAMLFCFGLAYAAALFYSRSLWPAVGLHWGWNYAGQLADRVAGVEVLDRAAAAFVSPAAHLVLLALVVLCARRACRQGARCPAASIASSTSPSTTR